LCQQGVGVPKILIADDDRTTVRLLQTLLELDGFDVVAVGRGADILPALHEHEPDLVLMDYHLSDMDGVEVVRSIRSDDALSALPIVMASGLDVQEEAIGAGATLFLVKPFDPGNLARLFNKLIAG
jgi:two-component system response regulator MtrA